MVKNQVKMESELKNGLAHGDLAVLSSEVGPAWLGIKCNVQCSAISGEEGTTSYFGGTKGKVTLG